jgi:hypothetical protein
MNEIMLAVIAGTLTALGSMVGIYWKARKDLEIAYDTDLRNQRIQVYKELWKRLQPLAKYSRPEPVTYQTIKKLSETLRQWYFEEGGLFLSERSRDAYFALQDELTKKLAELGQQEDKLLPETTFEYLRKKGSDLRSRLTEDVGTRKASQMAGDS